MRAMILSILVPTLGRAGRLSAVLSNIHENTVTVHEVIFVTERDDAASCDALGSMPMGWVVNQRSRSYAGAINTGYQRACGDYIFAGADDLRFHPGWDVAALAHMRDPVRVVGTNDMYNDEVLRGVHATHYLIDRRYIDEVGGVPDAPPGVVLFEGYGHNFTDTEFILVARARGVFVPGLDSVVEHMHAYAGKAAWDETYAKGRARDAEDSATFTARVQSWMR